jgi:CBS domain containing-hemolysin-like protein
LPVFRGTIDNTVGILRTKDLVRWFVEGRPGATLAELMRPIPSVHESVSADRVLKDLRERRSHQALVVDEFGGTAGLLTLADVLTELLGSVGDEFKTGQFATETLADGRIRLAGEMGVDDVAILLATSWETDASTVGGLVTEALGHIPSDHESVLVGDYEFEVERVKDRIPQSVIARRVVPVPSEDLP